MGQYRWHHNLPPQSNKTPVQNIGEKPFQVYKTQPVVTVASDKPDRLQPQTFQHLKEPTTNRTAPLAASKPKLWNNSTNRLSIRYATSTKPTQISQLTKSLRTTIFQNAPFTTGPLNSDGPELVTLTQRKQFNKSMPKQPKTKQPTPDINEPLPLTTYTTSPAAD